MSTIKRIPRIRIAKLQKATHYLKPNGVVTPVIKRGRVIRGIGTREHQNDHGAKARTGTAAAALRIEMQLKRDHDEKIKAMREMVPVGIERAFYDRIVQERRAEGRKAGDPREILATARARMVVAQHKEKARYVAEKQVAAESGECIDVGKLTDTPGAGSQAPTPTTSISTGVPGMLTKLMRTIGALEQRISAVLAPSSASPSPLTTRSALSAQVAALVAHIESVTERVDL